MWVFYRIINKEKATKSEAAKQWLSRGLRLTDISVFIPVFRESDQLPSMLHKLESQVASKEIIVCVDEPSEAFLENVKQFENVQFLLNKERTGKANALNNSVKQSSGKILLFLDADVEIADDPEFLTKIVREMANVDVLTSRRKWKKTLFLRE